VRGRALVAPQTAWPAAPRLVGKAFYRVRRRRTAEAHLHASATASPRCGCPWSPSARGAAGGSVCTPTRTGRR